MEKPKVYYLFVYGSLLSGFKSPAYEYLSRYFKLVAPAKIRGRLYDMGDYPAAIPATTDEFIKGELYIIKNDPEFSYAMGQLDDYEGTTVEPGESQLYYRELTDVYHDNIVTKAWVYWYNGDTTGKPIVSSGDILQYHQQKNN
ncbi:MAG: gamma-glutamylcyclotransferase [Chitinophagaceae bacterium]|nr:gamma-glutamylcyclotransferase [Chitinophagaceae bacterium]